MLKALAFAGGFLGGAPSQFYPYAKDGSGGFDDGRAVRCARLKTVNLVST